MTKLLLCFLLCPFLFTCKSTKFSRSGGMLHGGHGGMNKFDNPDSVERGVKGSFKLAGGAGAPASGPWSAIVGLKHVDGRNLRPIHASLLPDGQILFITGTADSHTGRAPVFTNDQMASMTYYTLAESGVPYADPSKEALYCSGHAFDAGGGLFTSGGIAPIQPHNYSYRFSYRNAQWHRAAQPSVGIGSDGTFRYYPTVTTLHDGRMLVTASAKYPQTGYNHSVAIYNPVNKSWQVVSDDPDYSPGSTIRTPREVVPHGDKVDIFDYPHVFLLPENDASNPKVIMFSSAANPVLFHFNNGTWDVRNNLRPHLPQDLDGNGHKIPNAHNPNGGSSLAMLPIRRQNGEWGYNNGSVFMASGNHFTSFKGRADVYDPQNNSWNGPTNGQTLGLGITRHHPTVVTLPDGRMFITNGHAMDGNPNSQKSQYIDPANGFSIATEGVPQQLTRGYHNIALLVPDGRILIGSGRPNGGENDTEQPSFQFYSPDYMTKPRANLVSVPQAVTRGKSFAVAWQDDSSNPGWGAQGIREAVLMSLGTVTHSINMGQRYIEIQVESSTANSVSLNVNSNPTHVPPGYYILYLLNGGRVPTIGKIIRVVDFDLGVVPSLAGTWRNNGQDRPISQNGLELVFSGGGGPPSTGYFLSPNRIVAEGWGYLGATIDGNRVSWDDGSHWDLQGEYPNLAGDWKIDSKNVRIEQAGTSLTFYNEHGHSTPGYFRSYSQVVATNWGLTGNLVGNEIRWSSGPRWYREVDLSGNWRINGNLVRIEQSGLNLTFFNEHGGSSAGHFVGSVEVVATDWGSLRGTISGNKLNWSNGTVWTKAAPLPDLSGDWISGGSATRIEQSGGNITFFNEHGGSSPGTFNSETQVVATGWGGLVGNLAADRIEWTNGTVWQRANFPDLAGDWNINGVAVRIEQTGTSLTFINEHGGSSAGRFNSPSQVVATGWGGLVGNLVGNNIEWSNGTVWSRN